MLVVFFKACNPRNYIVDCRSQEGSAVSAAIWLRLERCGAKPIRKADENCSAIEHRSLPGMGDAN